MKLKEADQLATDMGLENHKKIMSLPIEERQELSEFNTFYAAYRPHWNDVHYVSISCRDSRYRRFASTVLVGDGGEELTDEDLNADDWEVRQMTFG